MKDYKKKLINILAVILGNAIMALGVVAFVVPAGIPMGGATGVGIALNHFWGVRISIVVFLMNSFILLIAWFVIGADFVGKTILSVIIYPILLEVIQKIPGITNITDNIFLAAIYGGILIGLSMAVVVRVGGSTGGTDAIGMILNKKTSLSVGTGVYLADVVVLGMQAVFSDMEQILYAILVVILTTIVMNKMIPNGKTSMQVMIISKEYRKIQKKILREIEAGVTLFQIQTGCAGEYQQGVMCVIPRHKLFALKEMVCATDPNAFLTITQINEVNGQGFTRERVEYNELRYDAEESDIPAINAPVY